MGLKEKEKEFMRKTDFARHCNMACDFYHHS
jgi:hypothetical protein